MNPVIENHSSLPGSQKSHGVGLTPSPPPSVNSDSKHFGRPDQSTRLRRLMNLDPADIDAVMMEPGPTKHTTTLTWWARGEFGLEESSSSPEKKAGGSDASSLASLVDRLSQIDMGDTTPNIDRFFRRAPNTTKTKKQVKQNHLKTRSTATSSSKGDAKITDFFPKRSQSKK